MPEFCLKPAEGLAKVMTTIVTVFEAARLTVSEKKTETICCGHRIRHPGPSRSPSKQQARGVDRQRKFIYLGGLVNASADIMPEIKRRVRLAWEGCKRFQRELYDVEAAPFTLKVPMLKAEVIETLLYGCATWTLGKEDFAELRTAHHRFLLRIIGFQRQQRTHHHVVRQGPQEGTMRERRDHYPQTASPL